MALILQGSAIPAPNPELHNTSWYDSAMWTTQDQKQRKIAIHFVRHDEILQEPENSLLMIEGKTTSYCTVSTLSIYKLKIC